MRLLLDTVAFIWAATSPERISRRAMNELTAPSAIREISTISLSEIAIKASRGKFAFSEDDVVQAIADLQLRVLPYTADHALQLFTLPAHHADPFDRQILAQALVEEIPIVTSDTSFRLYEGATILW